MTRRAFGRLGFATGLAALMPVPSACALTTAEAHTLVDRLVSDIFAAINSGRSEAQVLREFEQILVRYADIPIIAQSVLGPPARSASRAQMRAFTEAFQGYIARKYGRRFREFIDGRIIVTGRRQVNQFFEIVSTVRLRNESPFELIWLVSDRSGQNRFFNLIIEGVNLITTERTEIGGMLDRRGGDIDALIAHLRTAG
ncbi:MAG: ABC transporter substrate-binding protein [Rhodobacteraceae bacterium]|nr:ABC transporter substrate-binding protein [Paracoccaceae bacterium]